MLVAEPPCMNHSRVTLLLLQALAISALIGCSGTTQDVDVDVRVGRFWFRGEVRQLRYQQVGDLKIFEGDVILDPRTEILPSSGELGRTEQAMVARGSANLWDGAGNGGKGVIPILIDKSIAKPDRVKAAMAQWEAKTSIRFVDYGANPSKYTSYVAVVNANLRAAKYQNACWATTGRTGGRQEIILDEDICTADLVAHEIGHTVGLLHEHTRSDRNAYVRWFPESTKDFYKPQFDVRTCADGTTTCDKVRYGEYDVASIMHYASTYFTNGTTNASGHTWTLAKRNSDGTYSRIIFSGVLSTKDVAGVQRLYGFDTTSPPIAPDPDDKTADPGPTQPTGDTVETPILPVEKHAAPNDVPAATPETPETPAATPDTAPSAEYDPPAASPGCQVGRATNPPFAIGAFATLFGAFATLFVALRRRMSR